MLKLKNTNLNEKDEAEPWELYVLDVFDSISLRLNLLT